MRRAGTRVRYRTRTGIARRIAAATERRAGVTPHRDRADRRQRAQERIRQQIVAARLLSLVAVTAGATGFRTRETRGAG
ncbi:hypothetical protein P0E62_13715, partial [Enterococcus faecalis]|uniref:hypothetical protein n=1 Tax=Enterococcus faecalis TaxID=1351 RepID=UPI0025AFCE7D